MFRTGMTALACALVAACSTAPSSTPPAFAGCKTYRQQAAEGLATVSALNVLSPELAQVIGVLEVRPGRTAGGLVSVQATLYNCSDVDVAVLARTHFTGASGLTEPVTAWRNLSLPPRARVTYAETAVSVHTSRVNVEVHDANRGQSQFAPGQRYVVPKSSKATSTGAP